MQAAVPTYVALYTSNRVKVSKVSAVLAGFQDLADIQKAGYQNKDFATAKLAERLKYLINRLGAHYPVLSFVATDLNKMDLKLADGIGILLNLALQQRATG